MIKYLLLIFVLSGCDTNLDFKEFNGEIGYSPTSGCQQISEGHYLIGIEVFMPNGGYNDSITCEIPENKTFVSLSGTSSSEIFDDDSVLCEGQNLTQFIIGELIFPINIKINGAVPETIWIGYKYNIPYTGNKLQIDTYTVLTGCDNDAYLSWEFQGILEVR